MDKLAKIYNMFYFSDKPYNLIKKLNFEILKGGFECYISLKPNF